MNLSHLLTVVTVAMALSGSAYAQGIPVPAPPLLPLEITTAGGFFYTQDGNPLYQLAQGETFSLDVNFFLSDSTDTIQSFSFTAPILPYLTYDGFTSKLPVGWNLSFSNNGVQATNVSGDGLSAPNGLIVGDVQFTVDPNAPIGTALTVPSPATFSITDAQNQQLNYLSGGYLINPTVIAAPEPTSICLGALGMILFALGRCRRRAS